MYIPHGGGNRDRHLFLSKQQKVIKKYKTNHTFARTKQDMIQTFLDLHKAANKLELQINRQNINIIKNDRPRQIQNLTIDNVI